MSRNWQAFTTRYNVYYNGKEHYNEQLKEMEAKYEDDYSSFLLTHPAEARADQKRPQPQGDFKRTIEKMQKAIQLHSIKKKPAKRSSSPKDKAFRARDEFNPFLHNAWLTMGKGQYFNGDFMGAASTFFYISKHFTWLPDVVTEARLWMAISSCALDWTYEAENALRLVKEKQLTNQNLRNLYNRAKADYLIRTDKYAESAPYLLNAARKASGISGLQEGASRQLNPIPRQIQRPDKAERGLCRQEREERGGIAACHDALCPQQGISRPDILRRG